MMILAMMTKPTESDADDEEGGGKGASAGEAPRAAEWPLRRQWQRSMTPSPKLS